MHLESGPRPETEFSIWQNKFSKGSFRLLQEAGQQTHTKLNNLVEISSYPTRLTKEGAPKSPDAGKYKVLIPGNLDLAKSTYTFTINDLPAFVRIEGSLRVPLGLLTRDLNGSLDVKDDIVLVSPAKLNFQLQQKMTDAVEALSGLSFGGKIRIETPPAQSKLETVEQRDPETSSKEAENPKEIYAHTLARMSREEFGAYLTNHGVEYGERTSNESFAKDQPYFIYNELVKRPEFRGMTSKEVDEKIKVTDQEQLRFQNMTNGLLQDFSQHPIPGVECSGGITGFIHWKIQDTIPRGDRTEKAYLTLKNPVDELNPTLLRSIISNLAKDGFHGQFKIHGNIDAMKRRFDTIVIHGGDTQSVEKALQTTERILSANGAQVSATDRGFDDNDHSHTEILANKIKQAASQRRRARRSAKKT